VSDAGGDPACWAGRVCLVCGMLDERERRDGRCPHCHALSDEDYERLLEVRDGLRRFLRWSEEQSRAAGVTPAQHQLLLAVRGHPGGRPTVGEVADHLLLRHHSAVGLVDRAEALGLVDRRRDAQDHRVVRVALTGRGEATLAALAAEHLEELRRLGQVYRDLGTDLPDHSS
jgi:DNA-binding MarR family transcriptional regulator